MWKLVVGFVVGLAAMLAIVIGLMTTGTPFESIPCKYGPYEGDLVFSTPRFVIIYKGMEATGGGMFSATISGQHGTLPAFWGGYGCGFHGGPKGIDTLHTYEPGFGTATLFVLGKLVRVEQNGNLLRVQDGLFDMSDGKVIVVVDEEGLAHQLVGEHAQRAEDSLDVWFSGFEHGAEPVAPYPPYLLERYGTQPDSS